VGVEFERAVRRLEAAAEEDDEPSPLPAWFTNPLMRLFRRPPVPIEVDEDGWALDADEEAVARYIRAWETADLLEEGVPAQAVAAALGAPFVSLLDDLRWLVEEHGMRRESLRLAEELRDRQQSGMPEPSPPVLARLPRM